MYLLDQQIFSTFCDFENICINTLLNQWKYLKGMRWELIYLKSFRHQPIVQEIVFAGH